MWLERLANQASGAAENAGSIERASTGSAGNAYASAGIATAYPFPFAGEELDFRPLLEAVVRDRLRGRDTREIARAFQRGIAKGLCEAIDVLCRAHEIDTAVLSGGVFQNELLLRDVKDLLNAQHESGRLKIWTNHVVPANDGGISLGQAALAAFENLPRAGAAEETDSTRLAHVT
jgi:hydrogenase maturation factor HypF (carbamoyltransferase family)